MTKKDGHPFQAGQNPQNLRSPSKRPGTRRSARPAEDALEKSLSLLKATVESTADGILVVDRNGRIETRTRSSWRCGESPPSWPRPARIPSFWISS